MAHDRSIPVKLYQTARPDFPFQVAFRIPNSMVNGRSRRKVKWFRTRKEAEEYRREVLREILVEGAGGARLELVIKLDALAARQALDAAGHFNVTLLDLAKAHATAIPAGLELRKPIGPYVDRFLDEKSLGENRAMHTRRNLNKRINAWIRRAEILTLGDITRDSVTSLRLREGVSAQTRKTDMNAVSGFCAWLVDQRLIATNPLLGMKRPVVPRTTRHVLDAASAARLLEAAFDRNPPACATAAVMLFAGLRPSELGDSALLYTDTPAIRVEGGKLRGRANRIVKMQPALRAWLKKCDDPLKVKPIHPEIFREICKNAQVDWIPDLGRHSYISYRVAIAKDIAAVAQEGGTSEAVILRHYARLVTKKQAQEYWACMPNRKGVGQ